MENKKDTTLRPIAAQPTPLAAQPLQVPATLANPKPDMTLRPIAPQPTGIVNPQTQKPDGVEMAAEEMINFLKEQRSNSEAEQKKLRQRMKAQKAREAINSLSNGLSAIANLYYTTKGAPAAAPRDNSSMQKQYDRLMGEYQANKEKIENLSLKIGDMGYRNAVAKVQREQNERKQKLAEEKEAHRQAMAEAKNEREQKKADLYMQRQAGLITAQELRNGLLEVDNKYAEAEKQAKLRLTNAQTARGYAQTNKVNNESKKQVYGYVRNEYGENVAYYDPRSHDKATSEAIQGGWMEYGPDVVSTTTTVEKNPITGKDDKKVQTTRKPGTPVDKKGYVYKTRTASKQSPAQRKREQQQQQQVIMPGITE